MEGKPISSFWFWVDRNIEGPLRKVLSYAWPFAKRLSGSQRLLRAVVLFVVVYVLYGLVFLFWLGATEGPPKEWETYP